MAACLHSPQLKARRCINVIKSPQLIRSSTRAHSRLAARQLKFNAPSNAPLQPGPVRGPVRAVCNVPNPLSIELYLTVKPAWELLDRLRCTAHPLVQEMVLRALVDLVSGWHLPDSHDAAAAVLGSHAAPFLIELPGSIMHALGVRLWAVKLLQSLCYRLKEQRRLAQRQEILKSMSRGMPHLVFLLKSPCKETQAAALLVIAHSTEFCKAIFVDLARTIVAADGIDAFCDVLHKESNGERLRLLAAVELGKLCSVVENVQLIRKRPTPLLDMMKLRARYRQVADYKFQQANDAYLQLVGERAWNGSLGRARQFVGSV